MDSTGSQSAAKTCEVTEIEIGWLAGMIDGEGYVGLKKHLRGRRIPRCTVVNTDFALIEKYAGILKRIGVGCYINRQSKKKYSELWSDTKSAETSGFKRCKKLLEVVVPHLTGIKQAKTMVLLTFIYSRLLKPGGGRGGKQGHSNGDYDEFELSLIETIFDDFTGKLNEFTPERIDDIRKMYSELRGKLAEAAEMTARPQLL